MLKPKPSIKKPVAEDAARRFAKGRGTSGHVPNGDKRLTANIREDLHLRLKIGAARRSTTIGEMLERMIKKEFPDVEE